MIGHVFVQPQCFQHKVAYAMWKGGSSKKGKQEAATGSRTGKGYKHSQTDSGAAKTVETTLPLDLDQVMVMPKDGQQHHHGATKEMVEKDGQTGMALKRCGNPTRIGLQKIAAANGLMARILTGSMRRKHMAQRLGLQLEQKAGPMAHL